MCRSCSNCHAVLNDQPALEGVGDPLCFPCRFRFDEAGGQPFLIQMNEYRSIRAQWESRYGKQWTLFQKRQSLVEKFNSITAAAAIGAFFSWIVIKSTLLAVILAIGTVTSWFASRIARGAAEKLRCDPPPSVPLPDHRALYAKPQLFFDASHPRVGQPAFDIFDGYPPDWSERKEFVLNRDDHRCKLCTNTENLHVHHVWPVSFSSNHTPQNLITLCLACHMKQAYWEHDHLVLENIKAKKRHIVRTYTRKDGTVVQEHKRKVGRRGNFWKHVHVEKSSFREKGNRT
jgi:hypothetical protein